MKLVRSPEPPLGLLFLVPSVNVILTLVFFILLATSFLMQPGLPISVPSSPFLLAPQRHPRVVSITSSPAPAIFFNDRAMPLDEFRTQLSALKGKPHTIIIKADRNAPYELVIAATNTALSLGFPVVMATSTRP